MIPVVSRLNHGLSLAVIPILWFGLCNGGYIIFKGGPEEAQIRLLDSIEGDEDGWAPLSLVVRVHYPPRETPV